VAGYIHRFTDEEESWHGPRLKGARLQAIGIDAAGCHLGLLEAFGSYGMERPTVKPALGGLDG
jgi:hypothetical protein